MQTGRSVPYPISIFELSGDIQDDYKIVYSDSEHEYTEIIKSRNREPSTEVKTATTTVDFTKKSDKFRPPPPAPALNRSTVLRSSLRRLDELLDRTQMPLVIQYKTPIKIVFVVILTWQLVQLADQLAHFIRSSCGL